MAAKGELILIALSLLLAVFPVMATASATEATISPGTVITPQNWRQYKLFMPDGMKALFAGTYFFKFPPNFRMVVAEPRRYDSPSVYVANTEKYSHLVKIVNLPDGDHALSGYVAGLPFPNPKPPLKGWKILVDDWYAYVPYVICGANVSITLEDRLGNVSGQKIIHVYRRLSHVSDAGQPIFNSQARGIYNSEYIEVELPEQVRYTAQLTLYYDNPSKPEDLYLFIPALRRTLRMSSAARCSPVTGTDFTQDDVNLGGFNGGIARFDANYLRDQPILALQNNGRKAYGNPKNYYPVIFFPKPAVGSWAVRGAWVIDVRRIPSQGKGYCYGKRIMYVDKATTLGMWNDEYDADMKLWKIQATQLLSGEVPGEGILKQGGNLLTIMYDIQNDHLTRVLTADAAGQNDQANSACRNLQGRDFLNVNRYNSPAGLSLIMR